MLFSLLLFFNYPFDHKYLDKYKILEILYIIKSQLWIIYIKENTTKIYHHRVQICFQFSRHKTPSHY